MADAEAVISLFVPIVLVFIIVNTFSFGGGYAEGFERLVFSPIFLVIVAFFFIAPDFFMGNLLSGAKVLFFMTTILWIVSATGGMR